MIIVQENREFYTYNGNKYRYGELSLNYINYSKKNTFKQNLFIDFKKDFDKEYSGDNFKKLTLFSNAYSNLIGKRHEDKQAYCQNHDSLLKLLQTPYHIVMHHSFKEKDTKLEFKRFQDFLIFDLYNFCSNDTFILPCRNCNNLFVTKTWGEKVYCSKTCRIKYSNKISKEQINSNPIIKEYYVCRKRYYMRIDRNPEKYCKDIFDSWNDKALKLKKECKSNENKYYEFENFLKIDPFKET